MGEDNSSIFSLIEMCLL